MAQALRSSCNRFKLTRSLRSPWHAVMVLALLATAMCQHSAIADEKASPRRSPLVKAIERVDQSVVNIRGRKTVRNDEAYQMPNQPLKQVNGMGTGVVIDPRGFILTNYHVVEDVRQIKVTTKDRETLIARLVAHDESTDLAIIKINPVKPLKPIVVGCSSDIMLGESVAAIGNAYGYENTVTVGIISALKRRVQVSEDQVYDNLIQTDASINPGNSGGPLINMEGEMVGINVAVRVNAQGIAFAIPVNDVLEIASGLLADLNAESVFTGIETKTVYQDNQPKIVVESVVPNSPADAAGFRCGDLVSCIAGQDCCRAIDFHRALIDARPGQSLKVRLARNDEQREIDISLSSPVASSRNATWKQIGVRLAPVNSKVMRQLTSGFDQGMQVVEVRKGSPAYESSIIKGDILVAMDGWKTESLENVMYVLNQKHVRSRQAFEYYLFRGNQPLYGKLQIEKAR